MARWGRLHLWRPFLFSRLGSSSCLRNEPRPLLQDKHVFSGEKKHKFKMFHQTSQHWKSIFARKTQILLRKQLKSLTNMTLLQIKGTYFTFFWTKSLHLNQNGTFSVWAAQHNVIDNVRQVNSFFSAPSRSLGGWVTVHLKDNGGIECSFLFRKNTEISFN